MAQQEYDGRTYDAERVRTAVAAHLNIAGYREGDLKDILRKCYRKTGMAHSHHTIDNEYAAYINSGRLPECVFEYYLEHCANQASA